MSEHVPAHVGLILDGNRRWAKRNGLPLVEGHRQGYKTLRKVLDVALESGVQYVSAFVFSTENWRRTQEEVGYLMDLTLRIVTNDLEELHKKGIKVAWVGSEDRVSDKLRQAIRNAEALTKENTGGTLALCFNYGGQREIADALRIVIIQSSTLLPSCFAMSRRRSSVSGGIGTRTTRPSSVGFSPKLGLLRIAVAIACKLFGSNGVIWISCASGAVTVAV